MFLLYFLNLPPIFPPAGSSGLHYCHLHNFFPLSFRIAEYCSTNQIKGNVETQIKGHVIKARKKDQSYQNKLLRRNAAAHHLAKVK